MENEKNFEDISDTSDSSVGELNKVEQKYVHVINELNKLENEIYVITDDLCKLISNLNNTNIKIGILKDFLLE